MDGVFLQETDVLAEFNVDKGAVGEDEIENDAVHVFLGHNDDAVCIDCSPVDPTLVATGACDNHIFLWRIGSEAPPCLLEGHSDTVAALEFSKDGRFLASGGIDGIVNVWDVSAATLRHQLEGPGDEIEWLNWHPRGYFLLAGCKDFSTWMWNAENGSFATVFIGHKDSVLCGYFTPDGGAVCTGSEESFRVWDPKSGVCTSIVSQGINCMTLSSDSKLAITGSNTGIVSLINLQNGKVLRTSDDAHEASVECISISPGLPILATCGQDKKLIIWDLQRLTPRYICQHASEVYRLAWCSDELVCTGCEDGNIWLWNARSGVCLKIFQGHAGQIEAMATSSDGQFVVSVSQDSTAMVFQLVY